MSKIPRGYRYSQRYYASSSDQDSSLGIHLGLTEDQKEYQNLAKTFAASKKKDLQRFNSGHAS